MRIVNSLEDSDLLIKGFNQTIENETREQRGWFIGMLLGRLGPSLLGNVLAARADNDVV